MYARTFIPKGHLTHKLKQCGLATWLSNLVEQCVEKCLRNFV